LFGPIEGGRGVGAFSGQGKRKRDVGEKPQGRVGLGGDRRHFESGVRCEKLSGRGWAALRALWGPFLFALVYGKSSFGGTTKTEALGPG